MLFAQGARAQGTGSLVLTNYFQHNAEGTKNCDNFAIMETVYGTRMVMNASFGNQWTWDTTMTRVSFLMDGVTLMAEIDGTPIWHVQISPLSMWNYTEGHGVAADELGNIYCTFGYNGTIVLANGHSYTSTNGFDLLIMKLDPSKNIIWEKVITSNGPSESCYDIDIKNDAIYLGGGICRDSDVSWRPHDYV